jgi:polyphosphate kinase 2 (PPK2 family)
LPSLKKFIELGRRPKEKKKNRSRYLHLQGEIDKVAKHITNMMKVKNSTGDIDSIAPRGVILYFEGLDCAGKSSTGGLIQAALERAGYEIGMRQYNRPPTPEQRLRPWMDRFERPSPKLSSPEEGQVIDEGAGSDNQYNALKEALSSTTSTTKCL